MQMVISNAMLFTWHGSTPHSWFNDNTIYCFERALARDLISCQPCKCMVILPVVLHLTAGLM
jgi:hypothetical protein